MTPDNQEIRPDVLNYDDLRKIAPKIFDGRPKFTAWLMKVLSMDKVNAVHRRFCDTPGPEFVRKMLFDDFKIKLKIDNEQVLDHLPEGAFITVSNHPLGALDGIALIHIIASRRPEYKVMVNMFLNHISAMRPNFIAVDAWASNDPAKRAVSVNGIRTAMRQLSQGHPVGFFPAGAMSKTNWKYKTIDREWQESVLQIIYRAKVPVIPIYFHDKNSAWCNILGHVFWPARSIRIPAEVFRKCGKTLHITVGDPISPEEQRANSTDAKSLGKFLRAKTYALRGGE